MIARYRNLTINNASDNKISDVQKTKDDLTHHSSLSPPGSQQQGGHAGSTELLADRTGTSEYITFWVAISSAPAQSNKR